MFASLRNTALSATIALSAIAAASTLSATPAAAGSADTLVPDVVKVEVSKKHNGFYKVTATACFNTGGWSNPQLSLKHLDHHGNYKVNFKAKQPSGFVTQAFSTLTTTAWIDSKRHDRPKPKSVTVYAQNNSLRVQGSTGSAGSGACPAGGGNRLFN